MNHALTLALATALTFGAAPVSVEGLKQPVSVKAVEQETTLCQLSLYGTVGKSPHPWVSISISHLVEGEVVETSVIGQMKAGTSSGSLAALLASRLRARGALVTEFSENSTVTGGLFIEDVVSVRLDLPAGPEASVIFCDRPLGVLTLRPTNAAPGAGNLKFQGIVVAVDGKHRSTESVEVPIVEGDTGHDVCKRLFDRSLEAGWLPVRPKTDRWSPSRRQDSGKLESSEVKLSASGWELEVVAG